MGGGGGLTLIVARHQTTTDIRKAAGDRTKLTRSFWMPINPRGPSMEGDEGGMRALEWVAAGPYAEGGGADPLALHCFIKAQAWPQSPSLVQAQPNQAPQGTCGLRLRNRVWRLAC